ncbi:amidohydrolase family protein [Bauldia sp.]|uniref:amidohydrolase family protein n=1 Tax=Bauldia sp. TaxID=2575872 RepID=UPI003BABC45B
MPSFPIVDAHVHLYDPSAITFAWMKGIAHLNKPHLPHHYDERSHPAIVDGIVFLEVDAANDEHVDEALWVSELANSESRIQAMVASAPLERGPAAVESDVATIAKLPLARGIRRLIQPYVDQPGWCLQPDFVAAVQMLPDYDLSFDICIYHPQMADAIELVRQCPNVRFMLDHIGKPGIKDGIREPWWSQMRELAALPNVTCKISGVVTEADREGWTYDHVAPYVAHAIECFGFDRVVFSGDWPVVELASNLVDWIGVVDRVTEGASQEDLRKLYRDNAIRFYRM